MAELDIPVSFKKYPLADTDDNSRLVDAYTKDIARSIRNGVFALLMLFKVANSWNIMIWTMKKYRLTQGTWKVPEIRIIVAQFLKITLLLIAYFLQEMNCLYFVFIINSLCTYWLQWMLIMRVCVCLELEYHKVRCFNIFTLIQVGTYVASYFVLPAFFLYVDPEANPYYGLGLDCSYGDVYRKSIVIIFTHIY